MTAVDLNCDLGEGAGGDDGLLPLVTSANIACGAHAGSAAVAVAVARSARELGVRVGAHPGYPDRARFGRVECDFSADDIYWECVAQIGWLAALTSDLAYLKPHGAMYHRAMNDPEAATAVVRAAQHFGLAVVGLPGSELECAAAGRVRFVAEGFADRRYREDGSLVSRTEPDAMIHDPEEAVRQASFLVQGRGVQTLCVHGDTPQARAFVIAVREAFDRAGIAVRPWA